MFIPPRIVITKKCPRCQLRYPRKLSKCSHCAQLSNNEVEELKLRYQNERKGNANLGWLLIYCAMLITLGLVIYHWQ